MRFIQRTIFSSLNLFKKKLINPSPPASPEIIIFDPSSHHLSSYWIEDWISTSDKSYGGTSIAELTLEQMKFNHQQVEEEIKFLRFQGSMNMTTNTAKSLGVIGGFCAFRGEINSSELLDDYQGFEIICRSGIDTNVVLNMTLDNRTQEDVYQVFFDPPLSLSLESILLSISLLPIPSLSLSLSELFFFLLFS